MKHNYLLSLFFATVALLIGVTGLSAIEKSHDAALARNLNTFNQIVMELEQNYVDSIRTDEAFKAAIEAMLSTVDPYTEYFDADDRDRLTLMTTGEYAGIGSYITVRDSITYIRQPLDGSPSMKAGLLAGDKIVMVDSIDVIADKKQNVTSLLRGQPGTTVRVKVVRPWVADSVLVFDVVREKVKEPSVPYFGMVDDKTGYIELTSFINKSQDEVREAIDSLSKNPGFSRLILDLRGNGGGLVESAVDIVGYFVPKGTEVLRTKGKDSSHERVYRTTHRPILPDIPLITLIDGGSASASEITAGAFQDLDRGVLVGTRSFGKGLVQNTSQLPYGGLLKVTVAKYYMPSGRLIQALDYSHRNPDGSVARTPDSLTNVFTTLNKREVRDGGGLTPDSIVEWEKSNSLLYQLVMDNKIFDYVTKYVASNPAPASINDVVITDEMFEEFCNGLKDSGFKYDNGSEEYIKNLRNYAKDEGYLSDEAASQLDSLAASLKVNLDRDLKINDDKIRYYMARELATRWFGRTGDSTIRLRRDVGIDKALEIFDGDYENILKGIKKK